MRGLPRPKFLLKKYGYGVGVASYLNVYQSLGSIYIEYLMLYGSYVDMGETELIISLVVVINPSSYIALTIYGR